MSEQPSSSQPSGSSGSSGIRLPPISLLSGHSPAPSSLNKLPLASNLGISNFLNSGAPRVSQPPPIQSISSSTQHSPTQFPANHLMLSAPQQSPQQLTPTGQQTQQNQLNLPPAQFQHLSLPNEPHKVVTLPVNAHSEPLAKKMKLEEETIEATNSLASLSESHLHRFQHPDSSQNQPQQTPLLQTKPTELPPLTSETGATIHTKVHEHRSSKSPDLKPAGQMLSVKGKRMAPRVGPPVTLDTKEIEDLIAELYPVRRHLGTIIYNPTTTWATLQILLLPGLKEEDFDRFIEIKQSYVDKLLEHANYEHRYIPMIPPLSSQYINYTIEVKIPARFIETFKFKLDNNETKREIWGGAGGVYTDDSDILSILAHKGLFTNKINLQPWNKDKNWRLVQPLISKPGDVIPGDLSIELLLLPPLPQYYGFYANGLNSRSWTNHNKHDGLSVAIHNVKWETCDTYLHDKQTFKRYQGEMAQDKQLAKDMMNSKPGWKFNHEYYELLKEKFKKLDAVPVNQ